MLCLNLLRCVCAETPEELPCACRWSTRGLTHPLHMPFPRSDELACTCRKYRKLVTGVHASLQIPANQLCGRVTVTACQVVLSHDSAIHSDWLPYSLFRRYLLPMAAWIRWKQDLL